MTPITQRWYPVLLLGVVAAGACSFDQSTNPNSPDPIGANPTRVEVGVAAVGMLIAFRIDFADIPLDIGIMGREVLRFDGSDPRFTGELL
jgi:starch-binding outer membrane protein, SusD/RagB family